MLPEFHNEINKYHLAKKPANGGTPAIDKKATTKFAIKKGLRTVKKSLRKSIERPQEDCQNAINREKK